MEAELETGYWVKSIEPNQSGGIHLSDSPLAPTRITRQDAEALDQLEKDQQLEVVVTNRGAKFYFVRGDNPNIAGIMRTITSGTWINLEALADGNIYKVLEKRGRTNETRHNVIGTPLHYIFLDAICNIANHFKIPSEWVARIFLRSNADLFVSWRYSNLTASGIANNITILTNSRYVFLLHAESEDQTVTMSDVNDVVTQLSLKFSDDFIICVNGTTYSGNPIMEGLIKGFKEIQRQDRTKLYDDVISRQAYFVFQFNPERSDFHLLLKLVTGKPSAGDIRDLVRRKGSLVFEVKPGEKWVAHYPLSARFLGKSMKDDVKRVYHKCFHPSDRPDFNRSVAISSSFNERELDLVLSDEHTIVMPVYDASNNQIIAFFLGTDNIFDSNLYSRDGVGEFLNPSATFGSVRLSELHGLLSTLAIGIDPDYQKTMGLNMVKVLYYLLLSTQARYFSGDVGATYGRGNFFMLALGRALNQTDSVVDIDQVHLITIKNKR